MPRPSKRPKAAALEFCQGWVDEHGVWNNGFHCNKWGDHNHEYCCGDTEKYCCLEPASTTLTSTTTKLPTTPLTITPTSIKGNHDKEHFLQHRPSKQDDLFPIIIGASVGLVVIILIVFFILIVCCCYKIKKNKKKNSKTSHPISANKALSFNVEAEATSAVIAAQALQQQQQQALLNNKFNNNSNSFNNSLNNSLNNYNSSCNNNTNSFTPNNFTVSSFTPTPNNDNLYNRQQICNSNNSHCNNINIPCNNNHCNNNNQLHCGCGRNTGQHSPTADLDSLIATMQHNITNSWQQQHPDMDLNPSLSGCPYDQVHQVRPPSTNRIAGFLDSPHPSYDLPYKHLLHSSNDERNGSLSSPMALSSTEPPFKPLPHFSHPLPSSSNPLKSLQEDTNRGFNYSPHQMNELRQFKHLIQEYSDKKQRRDSGVLVEEPDIVQNTSSSGNTSFVPYTPAGSKNNDVTKPLPSPPAHLLDISRR